MKPVDDEEIDENGNEPVAATAPATTATATTTAEQKEEDPEKIDWDELLRTAPKEEGATDGEEVDIWMFIMINRIVNAMFCELK